MEAFVVIAAILFLLFFRKLNGGRPLGMPNLEPRRQTQRTAPAAHAFPVIVDDGPGTFVVRGVDRESRMDTVWSVAADSPDNARVKAELEGIVVTRVQRE